MRCCQNVSRCAVKKALCVYISLLYSCVVGPFVYRVYSSTIDSTRLVVCSGLVLFSRDRLVGTRTGSSQRDSVSSIVDQRLEYSPNFSITSRKVSSCGK